MVFKTTSIVDRIRNSTEMWFFFIYGIIKSKVCAGTEGTFWMEFPKGAVTHHESRRETVVMGALKYAILGLLYQKPRSGYEMKLEFESTLNEFWSAKHSQIYPELKKLADDGLVEYHVEIVGNVLEKKQYSITEKGREDFLQWMKKDVEMPPTPKREFLLQMFFCSCLQEQRCREMIVWQLRQHQNRLEQLRENQKKFPCVPPRTDPAFGDYLVLMHAIMREEANCQWLEICMRMYTESKE